MEDDEGGLKVLGCGFVFLYLFLFLILFIVIIAGAARWFGFI